MQKAEVTEMLKFYRAQMAERHAKQAALRPVLPPTHGPVDERGLTPAMRKLMESRSA